jgi:hypothetical protein
MAAYTMRCSLNLLVPPMIPAAPVGAGLAQCPARKGPLRVKIRP